MHSLLTDIGILPRFGPSKARYRVIAPRPEAAPSSSAPSSTSPTQPSDTIKYSPVSSSEGKPDSPPPIFGPEISAHPVILQHALRHPQIEHPAQILARLHASMPRHSIFSQQKKLRKRGISPDAETRMRLETIKNHYSAPEQQMTDHAARANVARLPKSTFTKGEVKAIARQATSLIQSSEKLFSTQTLMARGISEQDATDFAEALLAAQTHDPMTSWLEHARTLNMVLPEQSKFTENELNESIKKARHLRNVNRLPMSELEKEIKQFEKKYMNYSGL